MADLINRWYRAVGIDELATVDEIDHNYRHIENCDPFTDMVLVEDGNGRLVGYTRTDWWQVVDGARKYAAFAKIDPDMRGSDLALALLRSAIDHSVSIAATHDVDCPRVLEGWASDREPDFAAAYEVLGFEPVTFSATMVRPHLEDILDAPLPAGLELRPVESSHLRAIWEADIEAFRDHWGFSEQTEDDWQRFLSSPRRDESMWKVAWAGDRVVGQVRSYIDPEANEVLGRLRGWTEDISTRREWRKRGVARALICESLRELKDRGMSEAALSVHTENLTGAFRLYESLGYEVVERSTTYHRSFD